MAVYTDVGDEEISTFIASYGLGEVVSFKGIAEGVENTNYLVETDRGWFILTLYEKRVNPAELPFFLALMEHLAAIRPQLPDAGEGQRGPQSARDRRPAGGARDVSRRPVGAPADGRSLRRGRRGTGPDAPCGCRLLAHPGERSRHRRLAPSL